MKDAAQLERDGAVAVIPCLNERAHIGALIGRLLADPAWASPLVVVLDGGSTDGSDKIVARLAQSDPRVRLMRNPRRLQSAALNLAAQTFAAERRWMVRVDAHADYPANYISTLMAEARRTKAASVVVRMETKGTGAFQRAVAAAQNSRLGTGGSGHRVAGAEGFVDHGHHALFDIAAFLAAGGYDETFSHNEDAEFDVRLRRSGGRIWLTRAIEMTYYPRARPGALFIQYFGYGRGRARTFRRHRERPRLRQFLPVAVAPSLVLAGASPIWPIAIAPALAWSGACLVYGAALALKARSSTVLMAGPAAMIMHAAWSLGFWRGVMSLKPPTVGYLPGAPQGGVER